MTSFDERYGDGSSWCRYHLEELGREMRRGAGPEEP